MEETKWPFAFEREAREFTREMVLAFIREYEKLQAQFVNPENVQVFQHGTGWTFHQEGKGGFSRQTGELELHSVASQVQIDRIVAHDLSTLTEFVADMVKKFSEGFEKRIYQEVATVAEEAGNTFHIPTEGPLSEALMEMIRTSHLSVAADGTVPRPSLHLNPETLARIQNEVRSADPEFAKQAEELWKEKEEEARVRERQRLARYQ